jgi:hypothetical protein
MDDATIRSLVTRLARPHPSGGDVIERAAILAEGGSEATAILAWITSHAGVPEDAVATPVSGSLHGSRLMDGAGAQVRTPLRFVLPAGVCGLPEAPPLD